MNKNKIWIFVLVLTAVVIFVGATLQEFPLGMFSLRKTDTPWAYDTVTSGETTWVDVYYTGNTKGMSSFTSVFMQLDSINTDSVVGGVLMRESWDGGLTWERQTAVGTFTEARDLDTFYTVNLYPAPFTKWGIYNAAGANDSFYIEKANFFNMPR